MSETIGIFRTTPYESETGKKVLKVFEKLKRKANEQSRVRHDPRLAEHDDDLRSQELQQRAMKWLNIVPEVLKTEEGFKLSGDDYYDPHR